jgi:transposase InsO family protein
MSSDVRQWYRSCEVCCARKAKPTRPHHALQQDPVSEPLQRVAIDILGPLEPPTSAGNKYILVVVDYLTKWAEAYAMPNQTAEEVARHLVTKFVCTLGIPQQLHSDQGRQFESALFQQMCELLRIRKTRTTPLHPQSDGQTERMNRTLLDVLAKLARDNSRDWDEKLCFAMASYRSSVHRMTGETPNRLMLGREVATPTTLLAPPPPDQEPRVEWVEQLHERFRDTHARVVEATKANQRAVKSYADRRQRDLYFEPGEQVWLYDPKPRRGQPHKIDAHKWDGPYVVEKRISAAVYVVRRHNLQHTRVINVDRLMPYVQRNGDRFPLVPEETEEQPTEQEEEIGGQITELDEVIDEAPAVEVPEERRDVPEDEYPISEGVTTRPRRRQKGPARLADYEVEWPWQRIGQVHLCWG